MSLEGETLTGMETGVLSQVPEGSNIRLETLDFGLCVETRGFEQENYCNQS